LGSNSAFQNSASCLSFDRIAKPTTFGWDTAMGATPPGPELVALLFKNKAEEPSAWQSIIDDVTSQIQKHFQPPLSETAVPKLRFLDADPSNPEARVAELVISVGSTPSIAECKVFVNHAEADHWQARGVQIVLQPSVLYDVHRTPGLAVFDMDSTLIQQEVIDELARVVGLYDKVAAITEAAMRGEAPYTDFTASLRARVALLDGVPTSIWQQLREEMITFTPGAVELVKALRQLGWKTAVFSGGFINLASWVKDTLGLDYAHANQLVSDPERNVLTGELVPDAPIIHAEKKRELLKQYAGDLGIPIERVIAVGDGSNDLLMMGAAGLGIAFNAKPKVQLAAPSKLNTESLLDVMYILGYTAKEVQGLVQESPVA
jgi:phosphoserine phosphatase